MSRCPRPVPRRGIQDDWGTIEHSAVWRGQPEPPALRSDRALSPGTSRHPCDAAAQVGLLRTRGIWRRITVLDFDLAYPSCVAAGASELSRSIESFVRASPPKGQCDPYAPGERKKEDRDCLLKTRESVLLAGSPLKAPLQGWAFRPGSPDKTPMPEVKFSEVR